MSAVVAVVQGALLLSVAAAVAFTVGAAGYIVLALARALNMLEGK